MILPLVIKPVLNQPDTMPTPLPVHRGNLIIRDKVPLKNPFMPDSFWYGYSLYRLYAKSGGLYNRGYILQ